VLREVNTGACPLSAVRVWMRDLTAVVGRQVGRRCTQL
jgi:hypothetical protein